jgi:hypothetical protein
MSHPSAKYSSQHYWEQRFATETHYEWLCTFSDIAPLLAPFLGSSSPQTYLVLGTGTSSLPADLAAAYPSASVLATDYSTVLIEALQRQPVASSNLAYAYADMLRLEALAAACPAFGSLDAVFDKGALDALVSAEGDSWQVPSELLATSARVVQGVHAALREGGRYFMLSFSQPHFRAMHLLQQRSSAQGGGEGPAAGAAQGGGEGPAATAAGAAAQQAASEEDEGEWEADLNPDPVRAAIPPVAGSYWSHFEHRVVERGLGIFLYICTK